LIEKLKKFCGDSKYNEKIGTPWSAGEFTFATNGFILVRVPRLAEVPERQNVVSLKSVLEQNPVPSDGWVDAPGVEDLKIPACPRCKGKESNPTPCEECDGTGAVDFDNRWNSYEFTCKSCDGDGEHGSCKKCGGTGYLIDTEDSNIPIGGAEFKKIYILDLTRAFGPLRVAPHIQEGKACWLSFAGGHALLMPIVRAKSA
jgi:hypothetical protein